MYFVTNDINEAANVASHEQSKIETVGSSYVVKISKGYATQNLQGKIVKNKPKK